jgi:uncharacterized protein YndB with AHSA1/START domain
MPTLIPEDRHFVNNAPNRIVVERRVKAPPARIWELLTDTPGWTKWFPTMTSALSTSDPADGIGSSRRVHVGRLEADEQFIAWEPGQLWAFTIVKTNIPMAKRFTEQVELIPEGDDTIVRYTGAFEPLAVTRPIARIVEGQVKTAWANGLDGMADHLAMNG